MEIRDLFIFWIINDFTKERKLKYNKKAARKLPNTNTLWAPATHQTTKQQNNKNKWTPTTKHQPKYPSGDNCHNEPSHAWSPN